MNPGSGEYAVTSESIRRFREAWNRGDACLGCWERLDGQVGPMLPFLIRREWFDRVPFEELNLPRIKPEGLSPKAGEMWVLFCLLGTDAGGPLRPDGFPLILEWRKGASDSPLLSAAFHELAGLVRRQHGIEGWGLCPAFSRYGDKVSFTDPALFADQEDTLYVASAYGALAAGLICATSGRHPSRWPFPTLQWDSAHHTIAGVMGLERKLSVAADCGAKVVTVAAEQADAARNALSVLRRGVDGKRYEGLRICSVSGRGGPRATARRIAYIESKVRRTVVSAVAALAPFLLLLGVWTWDANRVKVVGYADYEERRGLLEGRVRAQGNDLEKCRYLFCYSGYDSWVPFSRHRILREVQCVDSAGFGLRTGWQVTGNADGRGKIVRIAYDYDDKHRLAGCRMYAADGVPVCGRTYRDGEPLEIEEYALNPDGTVDETGLRTVVQFNDKGGPSKLTGYFPNGEYTVTELNARGQKVRERFFAADGDSVPSREGAYGFEYEYWKDGRPAMRTALGADGKPMLLRGLGRLMYLYDDVNQCKQTVCVDDRREPMNSATGFARRLEWFDADGRVIRLEFRNKLGNLVVNAAVGYAGATAQYDGDGRKVEDAFYGADGKPVRDVDGYAFARYSYSADSREKRFRFFDERNEPCNSRQGIAGVDLRYDEVGNEIERTNVNTFGIPCEDASGCARIVRTFDQRRRITGERRFNAKGESVAWRFRNGGWDIGRIKGVDYTYDRIGNQTARIEAEEARGLWGGVDVVEVKNAPYGVLAWRNLARGGHPCTNDLGFAEFKCLYDEHLVLAKISVFGVGGELSANRAADLDKIIRSMLSRKGDVADE